MNTLVTIEAVHSGKVLAWTWKRIVIDTDKRATSQQQIGQAVMSLVDDMRLRGWSAESKAGISFRLELSKQTD